MAALVADYGSSESDGGSESEPEGVGGPRPPGAQARQQGSPLRSSSATGEPREQEEEVEGEAAKLPPPQLEGALPQVAGVFANPFAEERREQLRLLEKHVRLTGRLGEQGPGGPRICLPYRKDGRCRYGVNCKFAHDSDLPAPQGPDPGGQHSPQAPAHIAPGNQQAPAYIAPGNRQAPAHIAPGNQQAPAYIAPGNQQAPAHIAPGNRQAPAYIAPDNRQAPAYVAPGNSQPGTKRRPGLSPGLLPPKRSLKDYQAQRAKEGLGYL